MFPTKFQVNCPFGSGEEEAKHRFSRWPPWGKLGYPIGTILTVSNLQVLLMLHTKFQVDSVQGEKRKIDLQDGRHGGHLGFQIGMILAILDLQVTLKLPTMFQGNWSWQPSWISDWNDFSYF